MGTGWRGRTESRVKAAEPEAKYPVVQWVNRGGDLDPRHEKGGFFIPVEQLAMLGDPEFTGAEAVTFNFSSGGSSTGVLLTQLTLAVLGTRFAWVVRDEQSYSYSQNYVDKARSKKQALVLLRTADGGYVGPAVLTLTGMVTNDFTAAFDTHRQRVRKSTSGEGASPWFWMQAGAGSPVKRGHGSAQSIGTPIILVGELEPDTAYVGDAAADWIEGAFDTIQEWANAWKSGTPGAAVEEAAPSEGEEPPLDTSEPPLQTLKQAGIAIGEARARWSMAWNKLKKQGFQPPLLNNAWDATTANIASGHLEEALHSLDSGVAADTVQLELTGKLSLL